STNARSTPSSHSTCASSSSRVLAYSSTRNARSASATGRNLTNLAARGEDALQRDVEVERQIRLHVVVRLAATLYRQRLRWELSVAPRPALGGEVEREDPDLCNEWIGHA